MKIWGTKTLGNPVRVAIFLAEKGLDIPFEPVDLMGGAHRDADFVAKNPSGLVPVLELDDGSYISETVAICRYFERLHPEPPLMGTDARDEAIVEMWQRRVEYEVYGPIREVFRHSIPFVKALEPVQLADWADLNRPRITTGLTMLEAQLREHPFIAGDRFTIADITAIFAMQMAGYLKLALPDGATAIPRWRAAVNSRPSVASVMAQNLTEQKNR